MKFEIFKDPPDAGIVVKASLLTLVILISYFLGLGINKLLQLSDDYLSGIWCAVSAIVVFDDLPKNAKSDERPTFGHICRSFADNNNSLLYYKSFFVNWHCIVLYLYFYFCF